MSGPDKGKLKQIVILLAIATAGGVVMYSLQGFLTAFLGAVMFYVLLNPLLERLVEKHNWKRLRAVWLLLTGSFLVLLIPVFLFFYMMYYEAQNLANSPYSWIDYLHSIDIWAQKTLGIELLSDNIFTEVKQNIVNWLTSLLNQTLDVVGVISIMYFVLYYMLKNSAELKTAVMQFSPFNKKENGRLFIQELKTQTYSNAVAVPILAFLQGIVASTGYWIFGVDQPIFWGVVTGFFSILPVVGTAIIWVPMGFGLLITAPAWQGLGLLAYGALVIANIDNVLRFILQKRFADVHPLITVLGVITGLKVFGLPGLIFGPLLISYFLILIKVYRSEYWADAEEE